MSFRLPALRILLIVGFGCFFSASFAQSGAKKVTFTNFTVQENHKDYRTGLLGLLLNFDVEFSWKEPAFENQQFSLSYRAEQGSKTVFQSGNPQLPSAIFSVDKGSQSVSMSAKSINISVPYASIPLPAGEQTVNFVFSLANNVGTYPDCATKWVNFNNKKVVSHSIEDQEFTFQDLKTNFAGKDFMSGIRGIEISAKLLTKFKAEETVETSYDFATLVRNGSGKVVFDSRKAAEGHKTVVNVALSDVNGRAGGTLNSFVDFRSLDMEGPGEGEIVFLAMDANGGSKEVFSKKMTLQVPPKYQYEEQGFSASNLTVKPSKVDGVQGIAVNFNCQFTHYGTMRNPEKGNYYFFLALMDATGKQVIALERAPNATAGTTQLMDGFLPEITPTPIKGGLFIPFTMLNLPEGNHSLKYALMVSDINLGTKFPTLATGSLEVVKPKEIQYFVRLEKLVMVNSDYDTEVFGLSSNLPELQYAIGVGFDHYYESEYIKNSLNGVPGSCLLRLSEGDPINLDLYDVDSGFFNDTDKLGSWNLAYVGKGQSFDFHLQNTGLVGDLLVHLERK
jgi:hypothetical protein